jgi:hypothetical protein
MKQILSLFIFGIGALLFTTVNKHRSGTPPQMTRNALM